MSRHNRENHLPVVSRETYDAFIQTGVDEGKHAHVQRAIDTLKEQPVLSTDVKRFVAMAAESESEGARMTALALRVYALLSMQAESDALNKAFQTDI